MESAIDVLAFLIGAWLTTSTGGLVAWFLRDKTEQLEASPADEHLIRNPSRGFADGGKVIGCLERLLIYLFVLSDAPGSGGIPDRREESIFRFGELSDQKNRLEAEYITIGTPMSFVVGLAIAMGVRWITQAF